MRSSYSSIIKKTCFKEKKKWAKKSFWKCLINVVSSVSGLSLGRCCLLETPVTCTWHQQCWGCFVSLRGRWERPQNRNVFVRGLEGASRWHARVLSSGVCIKGWGGRVLKQQNFLECPRWVTVNSFWTWL